MSKKKQGMGMRVSKNHQIKSGKFEIFFFFFLQWLLITLYVLYVTFLKDIKITSKIEDMHKSLVYMVT